MRWAVVNEQQGYYGLLSSSFDRLFAPILRTTHCQSRHSFLICTSQAANSYYCDWSIEVFADFPINNRGSFSGLSWIQATMAVTPSFFLFQTTTLLAFKVKGFHWCGSPVIPGLVSIKGVVTTANIRNSFTSCVNYFGINTLLLSIYCLACYSVSLFKSS